MGSMAAGLGRPRYAHAQQTAIVYYGSLHGFPLLSSYNNSALAIAGSGANHARATHDDKALLTSETVMLVLAQAR